MLFAQHVDDLDCHHRACPRQRKLVAPITTCCAGNALTRASGFFPTQVSMGRPLALATGISFLLMFQSFKSAVKPMGRLFFAGTLVS